MNTNQHKIFETDYHVIFLMTDQSYLGRCVVVLKRDCGDLADVIPEEILDFHDVVKKFESALEKRLVQQCSIGHAL